MADDCSALDFEMDCGHAFERVYGKAQTKNYKMEMAVAENVLNKVAIYFSKEHDEIFATDIGSWEMKITNTAGKTYKFRGSLCSDFEVDGIDLSDLIRDAFSIQDSIISVGYRVNSQCGVQFRIWATGILKEYIKKGFAMDDDRLKELSGFKNFAVKGILNAVDIP